MVIYDGSEINYIKGFVSYTDYLRMNSFEKYVEEKNMEIPDRCREIMNGNTCSEAVSEGNAVNCKKKAKSVNPIAIITLILSAVLIAGVIVTYIIKNSALSDVFAGDLITGIIGIINNGESNIKVLLINLLFAASAVLTLCVGIGSIINVKANGTGLLMKTVTFIGFATAVVACSLEIMEISTVKTGAILILIITLIIFVINIIAKKKIKD